MNLNVDVLGYSFCYLWKKELQSTALVNKLWYQASTKTYGLYRLKEIEIISSFLIEKLKEISLSYESQIEQTHLIKEKNWNSRMNNSKSLTNNEEIFFEFIDDILNVLKSVEDDDVHIILRYFKIVRSFFHIHDSENTLNLVRSYRNIDGINENFEARLKRHFQWISEQLLEFGMIEKWSHFVDDYGAGSDDDPITPNKHKAIYRGLAKKRKYLTLTAAMKKIEKGRKKDNEHRGLVVEIATENGDVQKAITFIEETNSFKNKFDFLGKIGATLAKNNKFEDLAKFVEQTMETIEEGIQIAQENNDKDMEAGILRCWATILAENGTLDEEVTRIAREAVDANEEAIKRNEESNASHNDCVHSEYELYKSSALLAMILAKRELFEESLEVIDGMPDNSNTINKENKKTPILEFIVTMLIKNERDEEAIEVSEKNPNLYKELWLCMGKTMAKNRSHDEVILFSSRANDQTVQVDFLNEATKIFTEYQKFKEGIEVNNEAVKVAKNIDDNETQRTYLRCTYKELSDLKICQVKFLNGLTSQCIEDGRFQEGIEISKEAARVAQEIDDTRREKSSIIAEVEKKLDLLLYRKHFEKNRNQAMYKVLSEENRNQTKE